MKNKTGRIKSKTSRTAEMTCMSRAGSYYEKTEQYKSGDFIAPGLVPKFLKPFLKNGLPGLFKKKLVPAGLYEYVIARTKFIDSIFENALSERFDQILIFGAGFDSRGIRFSGKNSGTRIFELDVPVTQNAKINQLKKRKIPVDPRIIYIPINFNEESIEDKLSQFGFGRDKRSLFLMEGLLMYLDPQAVDSLFRLIDSYSGKFSEIVFDYIYASVLRKENLYYGEKNSADMVARAGEKWTFGIERGEIDSFLKSYHFSLKEHLDTPEMENRYFRDRSGNIIGKVNGTHCLVYAVKK